MEDFLPVPSTVKRGRLGVGTATPPIRNSLATETERRETIAPGCRREVEQATGFMKDGYQTRKDFLTSKTIVNIGYWNQPSRYYGV